ncbi:MAG: TRAP transporter small permease [Alphaproteobacteria bacterium]
MATFIRLITSLSRFLGGVAAALVAASLVLVCMMVVMRIGLGEPAPWPADIVTYLMMGLTFLGAPYVMSVHGHVTLSVMQKRGGHRWRVVLSVLAALVSGAFALAVTWAGARLIDVAVGEGWRADATFGLALWIPYLSLPVGSFLLALQCLAEILARVGAVEAAESEEPIGSANFPD